MQWCNRIIKNKSKKQKNFKTINENYRTIDKFLKSNAFRKAIFLLFSIDNKKI